MRDTTPAPRGEPGRIAERVRSVLREHEARTNGAAPTAVPVTPTPQPGAAADGTADDSSIAVPDPPPRSLGSRWGGTSRWDRLAVRLPVRLDPGRRSAVAIGLAVAVTAVLTGIWLLSSQPQSVPVAAPGATSVGTPLLTAAPRSSSTERSAASASIATAATEVVVDVAGKVHRPGLYRLPNGSRVDDAVTAAGGALHGVDLANLNLAARIVDGQQIAVGTAGASVPVAGSGGGGSGASGPAVSSASTLVDLNTATLEQLETLPGIGPALGQRILDYRTQHGSFAGVDQLDDVSGIGTVIFARLKPLVTT